MSEAKPPRKKRSPDPVDSKTPEPVVESSVNASMPTHEPVSYVLATGLEDYGRWKAMFQKYQRDPREKPFRRGRIWC